MWVTTRTAAPTKYQSRAHDKRTQWTSLQTHHRPTCQKSVAFVAHCINHILTASIDTNHLTVHASDTDRW